MTSETQWQYLCKTFELYINSPGFQSQDSCVQMYFNLYTWGMSQNRGAYMGAPNLFLFAKKEILGHPSFETFPHEKNTWSYFVCMFLFVVHRFLQYTMWDFMWNFKPLFFLKQHTYPVHGLAEIVCEIECIYVYFFTRLF